MNDSHEDKVLVGEIDLESLKQKKTEKSDVCLFHNGVPHDVEACFCFETCHDETPHKVHVLVHKVCYL